MVRRSLVTSSYLPYGQYPGLSTKMKHEPDPTSSNTDPNLVWTEQEEKVLVQLVEKYQERVDNGEISIETLFDEVSIELYELGVGTERTGAACNQIWFRIHDGRCKLNLQRWGNNKHLNADSDDFDPDESKGDSTDGDEESRELDDKIVGSQKKKRTSE